MPTTTLHFSRVDDLVCLIHDEHDPSAEDWALYVRGLIQGVTEHHVRTLLVVSKGGGPNATQRKQLVDALVPALGGKDARALKTAVCTSSPLARGITVALGWLTSANLTGFGYDDRRRALDYLGVPASRHAAVLVAVDANLDLLAKTRRAR